MSNPITAMLTALSTTSNALTMGIEGVSAYVDLWKKNQNIEHKYAHKTFKLEALAEHGKRATKAQEAIAALPPEVVAYLEE